MQLKQAAKVPTPKFAFGQVMGKVMHYMTVNEI